MSKTFKSGADGSYPWKDCSLGGVTRVAIENGQDIAHLHELDPKLWTVLSMPVENQKMDPKTLSILDSDSDGRIRVNEITAASQWLCSVLKDPELIVKGGDSIALASLSDSAEGKKLLEAA